MIIDWAKQNWKLATGIVVAAVIVGKPADSVAG